MFRCLNFKLNRVGNIIGKPNNDIKKNVFFGKREGAVCDRMVVNVSGVSKHIFCVHCALLEGICHETPLPMLSQKARLRHIHDDLGRVQMSSCYTV